MKFTQVELWEIKANIIPPHIFLRNIKGGEIFEIRHTAAGQASRRVNFLQHRFGKYSNTPPQISKFLRYNFSILYVNPQSGRAWQPRMVYMAFSDTFVRQGQSSLDEIAFQLQGRLNKVYAYKCSAYILLMYIIYMKYNMHIHCFVYMDFKYIFYLCTRYVDY